MTCISERSKLYHDSNLCGEMHGIDMYTYRQIYVWARIIVRIAPFCDAPFCDAARLLQGPGAAFQVIPQVRYQFTDDHTVKLQQTRIRAFNWSFYCFMHDLHLDWRPATNLIIIFKLAYSCKSRWFVETFGIYLGVGGALAYGGWMV